MKWLKQHGRGLIRVLAALLIGVGGFCGYWWFYKLAPSRCTLDPKWRASHSQLEYWREVQRGIHRGMWFHDDGFTVGMYGDKSWAERIMAHVKPGTTMDCMGGSSCHLDSSMRYITNQDVGEDADKWLVWWEKNKAKSQQEWIRDGFRSHGLEIDMPPTAKQVLSLLILLGNANTNELKAIPKEMKYNAFRCLRDSGFNPVNFAFSNRTASEEVQRGVMEYAETERRWPAASNVGILPFGRKTEDWSGIPLPVMLNPSFQITANALVLGPPLIGAVMLICSFRRGKNIVEPSPSPDSTPSGENIGDG